MKFDNYKKYNIYVYENRLNMYHIDGPSIKDKRFIRALYIYDFDWVKYFKENDIYPIGLIESHQRNIEEYNYSRVYISKDKQEKFFNDMLKLSVSCQL